jgi:FtsZ-interacting cell division protein YlmF
MSVSDAVLSYLRVLIWPALVCVLAFGFRSTIRSLLRVRLRQIDAAGFSAKFEEVAQDAERVAQAGRPQAPRRTGALDLTNVVKITAHTYNDARQIGENFREGKVVLLDLEEANPELRKRLIDFSAGTIFSGHGTIDRISNGVFLLTPAAFLDNEKPG